MTTKGGIEIEKIKIGDRHYEFEYGCCIESIVESLPIRDDNGLWRWQSRSVISDNLIDYAVNEKYTHYGPNLYDYMAYTGFKMI